MNNSFNRSEESQMNQRSFISEKFLTLIQVGDIRTSAGLEVQIEFNEMA